MHVSRTLDDIISLLPKDAPRLIAIDGFQAAGKTTLAKQLANHLCLTVVSADDYLNRNQGSFFRHLDLKKLSAVLCQQERCIFDGVCCLQVLQAIGVRANVLVYVKRMAIWGWADQEELETFVEGSSPFGSQEPDPLQITLHNLWSEVAKYHHQYRPHLVANIIHERAA